MFTVVRLLTEKFSSFTITIFYYDRVVLTEGGDKHQWRDYCATLYASEKLTIQEDRKEPELTILWKEAACTIIKMKPEKASEVDNIPAELLKTIHDHGVDLILIKTCSDVEITTKLARCLYEGTISALTKERHNRV